MRASRDGSDNERSTNRELVIPPPVESSDSSEDGVSPSQHKLAMKKQLSRKNDPPKSSSGSDEEEEEVEEEDADQSIDGQSGTSFQSKSSAAMYSKITEMSRQLELAEMMEMHRKQQVMEKKKSARSSLSFESPPPAKFRKFKSPFTPPRTAPDIIGATQADEDFERDSLASQSSRTTTRSRLQEKYVTVATLYKDELTPDEIKKHIREIAFTAMAKSVTYEDLDPADTAYGGLKKNNVRPSHV